MQKTLAYNAILKFPENGPYNAQECPYNQYIAQGRPYIAQGIGI